LADTSLGEGKLKLKERRGSRQHLHWKGRRGKLKPLDWYERFETPYGTP
jgi:hypothetical protein